MMPRYLYIHPSDIYLKLDLCECVILKDVLTKIKTDLISMTFTYHVDINFHKMCVVYCYNDTTALTKI